MKLTTLVFFVLLPKLTWAIGGPVDQKRIAYASTNVTTSAYVTVISSVSSSVSTIEVFDSSGQTLQIAAGPSGSEVVQFIVTPGGNGQVRLNLSQGTRLSIKALSATANAGELDVNLYN